MSAPEARTPLSAPVGADNIVRATGADNVSLHCIDVGMSMGIGICIDTGLGIGIGIASHRIA